MRRIEFIAPVEAMRGNLSGNQGLTYPTANNKAWDSPQDQRNYATNYQTRYIGARRAADGHSYFAVKQRSAVKMTTASQLNMAALSVGSVIADIIGKNLATLTALQQEYLDSPEYSQGWTFKRWLAEYVRQALRQKRHISFPAYGGHASIQYINPYISTTAPSSAVEVPDFPEHLLAKFWLQLADNAIVFYVERQQGIARSGNTFMDLDGSTLNILGITFSGGVGAVYVVQGAMYLTTADGTYVTDNHTITANERYRLTTVSPA